MEKSQWFSGRSNGSEHTDSMQYSGKTTRCGERRLTYLLRNIGSNLKEYGGNAAEKYFKNPYRSKDTLKKITGPVMAAVSAVLEGPDQIIAGAIDQQVIRPSGPLGRIRRDSKQLMKDVFTFHPIRAVADGLRLPSDVILDAGDAAGGFDQAA